MRNLIILTLAASPAAGRLQGNEHARALVGADYCVWGPNTTCYASGWPSCCSEENATVACPVGQPPCEIVEEGTITSSTSPSVGGATTVVSTTPGSGAEGTSSPPTEGEEPTTTSSTTENASGGSSTVATADSVTTIPLIGSSWVATEFFDGNSTVQVIPDTTITLSFDDEELSGNAGCNIYFMSVDNMTTSSFQIGLGGITEMYCEDQDLMSQETLYMQNFSGDTIGYNILDDGSLELLDGESNIIAHYVPKTSPSAGGATTTVSASSSEGGATTTVSTSSSDGGANKSLMENTSPVFVVSTSSMVATSICVCLVIW